ncbi:MAG: hypothetical protein P8L74_03255 [Gammaproteobacteria bacterium]|nr:hypothetical protein [Gammaproteobacteria bacterium]
MGPDSGRGLIGPAPGGASRIRTTWLLIQPELGIDKSTWRCPARPMPCKVVVFFKTVSL